MKKKRINYPSNSYHTRFPLKSFPGDWTLKVPLSLEEIAEHYFMNRTQFFKKNLGLFRALKLIIKHKGLDNIERYMYDSDLPYIGGSSCGKGEGMYLRINQRTGVSAKQAGIISNLFPLSIEGYVLRMHGFSDMEYDDDRIWYPSISFGIYKNNENILT